MSTAIFFDYIFLFQVNHLNSIALEPSSFKALKILSNYTRKGCRHNCKLNDLPLDEQLYCSHHQVIVPLCVYLMQYDYLYYVNIEYNHGAICITKRYC